MPYIIYILYFNVIKTFKYSLKTCCEFSQNSPIRMP